MDMKERAVIRSLIALLYDVDGTCVGSPARHKLWPAPDMTARISAHWSHSAGGWGHGRAASPGHCGLIDNQAGVLNTEY